MSLFTAADRERIRSELLEHARADSNLTGGAITGSGAAPAEDRWSDIDLGFGVADASKIPDVLADWTARMYERYEAVHHFDVPSGSWTYRVFLLASTLQVDLAFAPAAEFGARGPAFRLVFGRAVEKPHVASATAENLIGYAWLYALHARSSIARYKHWQAEYMISAMRDQIFALACVRHGLPAKEGRGMDRLPQDIQSSLEEGLVRSTDAAELVRAFRANMAVLIGEIRHVDPGVTERLEPALRELAA